MSRDLPTPASPLRELSRRYAGYRARLVAAVLLSTVNKVADVVPELLIGAAVDVVVRGDRSLVADLVGAESRYEQLVWLAVVNALVWVVESVSEYLAALTWRRLAQTVEHDLRVEAYAHVQQLDVAWHETRPAGTTLATLNDDVNQLERFLDVGAAAILQTVLNVVLVGLVFAAASPTLLVLAFAPIPVIVAGSLVFQRRLEPLYARVRETVADLSGTLSANLGGITTIKAFTAEERERERVAAASLAYRGANEAAIRSSAAFVPLVRIAILAGFTCTLLIGGFQVLDGTLEVGLYSVLVFMTQRLLWPLTAVAEVLDLYQRGRASAGRILGLLAVPVSVQPGEVLLAEPSGRIELRGVRAGYADGPDVLHDLDLVVPAGETHAVVGPTGSGKSTLLRLVLRFEDPRSGQVLLDDVDARDLEWSTLRGALGYVSQDVYLFSGSVHDNIAYGRPRRQPDRGRGGRAGGGGVRVRRGDGAGLRHPGRRARGHPVRRATAAARAGPGAAPRPRGAGARRGHLGGRQRDRGGHPALAGPGDGRAHRPGRGPPALHGPPRRPDLGARRGPDRGVRHPRRAGGRRRRVRPAVGRADRRPGPRRHPGLSPHPRRSSLSRPAPPPPVEPVETRPTPAGRACRDPPPPPLVEPVETLVFVVFSA